MRGRVAHRVSRSVLALGVLVLVCWTSVLSAGAAIVREPYLQQVTPTSVTVVWRTDLTSASDSQVQYGLASGGVQAWGAWASTASATAVIPPSNPNVRDHIVTITTSVTPGTKYFYAVGTGTDAQQGGGTVEHFFVTAPTVGTTTPFRAWIFGDSGEGPQPPEGTGDGDQERVRDAMVTETLTNPPDIILHAGDIAYNDGTDLEFTTNHFAMYQNILRHTPSWPTLGNHEAVSAPSAGVGPYYEAHVLPTGSSGTEAYYSFDYANVHFIVLDSMTSDRGTGDAMLAWLASDLGATSQDWVIALFHHPPYTKGSHDSDNVEDSGGRLTDMRENALPILEAGGVNLVLAGHSHGYERSYAIRGVYGYGNLPDFPTPDFGTLLGNGNILNAGDGNPNAGGDGAYQDGTVYVVAGHGGRSIVTPSGHPVMFFSEGRFGSVLLDINGTVLTGRNVRDDGSITDLFAINLPPANQPPTIITPPANVMVTEPNSATFRVVATGSAPLSYQWRRNGSNIPGATGSVYTLSATTVAADNGAQFDVVVANGVSNVTSAPATLTVHASPVPAWTAAAQNPAGIWRDSGFDNRTFRTVLKGTAITASGTPVQVTFRGRSSGSYTLENLSLVQRDGVTLNGVGPLTPVTFGGATSVTVPAGGTVTSDPIAFTLTPGQDVFLTFWVPLGSSGVYRDGGTETAAWYVNGTDVSAEVDWTLLTLSGTKTHVYDAELVEVSPAPDTTAPVLSTATVTGTNLVLTYNELLDPASLPIGTDFSIGTDGVGQTVNAVVGVTGTDVILTLTPGVAEGDTVTVTYTAGAVGARIQDGATNPADNLSGQPVTNNTAVVPVPAWTAAAQNPAGIWRDSGFDNRTFRTVLKGTAITASGTPVQVTFRGRSSGSYTLENLSLVQRDGVTLNGVGPLTPVTFGGATSVTVPAGGTVTSDPIAFTLTPGQDVFLTFWVPLGSSGVYRDGGTETAAWYVNGTDVSAEVDWTPLTLSGTKTHVYDAELVEVSPVPDTTAPVLSTATVTGTNLVLTYNELLDPASLPIGTDFSVGTDGVAQTVNAVVGVTGTDVILTLTPGVAPGDTVTVSYTAGTNPIQDGATNPAGNLSGQAVTNSTTDTTAPVLSTATVTGTSLVLNYIEANGLDTGSTPATTDFAIGNSGEAQTVSAVVVTANDVTLTLTPGVAEGDTVTVSYTAGTNPIQDGATNPADNLSGQPVTNSTTDTTAPVLSTATVTGTNLVLTYNELLDPASLPIGTDFSIGTDGVAQTVNAVVGVTGTDVILTLTPGVAPGDTVTVTYTAGAVGARIQDGATNPADNLSGQPVTNNTAVVPVPAWTAAAQNPAGIWRDSGFDNRTFRTVLKGTAITASGTPVQVTFRGRSSGSYTLENLSLVQRDGVTLNGVGPLTPVTFGGATSVTVPAGGTVTSDPIAFTLTPGQDVFLTFWVPLGSSGVYRDGGTETAAWYVNGTDVSAEVDWTLLTLSGTKTHVYDAELVEVSPVPDTTAPVLSTATVTGTNLVLTYNELLDPASLPIGTDFSIGTDGVGQTVNAVVGVTGTDVILTLTPGVAEGDTVTVTYTAGAVGARIQDGATNPADNLSGQPVTNNTAVVPVPAWTAAAQNPAGIWRDSGFDNRTFRTVLKGTAITASGTPVQVTFRGRSSGSYTLENLSLVQRDGVTLNGVGPLTPVTFGGATSVTVPAGGTVTSDPIAFTLTPGQDVFLTFWVPLGSSGVYRDGGTETAAWYVNGTDVSAEVDWTPLTLSGTKTHVYNAELVEVLPAP